MIWLTKLDGKSVLVNLEAVKYFESMPDTLVLFINGESVIVKESLDEIAKRTLAFRAQVLREAQGTP